ncbi:MAG: response regulator transcription factor [Opitutales bacterium]
MKSKQKPLVAVVADDRALCAELAAQLDEAGFTHQTFHKGATALRFLEENHVHLVLLEPFLQDIGGHEVLSRIRRSPVGPAVIMLSAARGAANAAHALDAGADDYVRLPHEGEELAARMRAVLRRTETSGDNRLTSNAALATGVFRFNGVEVHPERLEITADGRAAKIGRKEVGILCHLHANPGVIVSRHGLIHAVWGVHADVRSRSLDQYVAKLRTAFGRLGRELGCLRTIHGIGYWYEPVAEGQEKIGDGRRARRPA